MITGFFDAFRFLFRWWSTNRLPSATLTDKINFLSGTTDVENMIHTITDKANLTHTLTDHSDFDGND